MSNLSKFKDDLGFLVFKSRKPLVWLETFDYNLVMNLLREALPNAEEGNEAIWIWNASNQKVALYNVNSSNKKESICNSNEKESEDSIQLGELIPLFNLLFFVFLKGLSLFDEFTSIISFDDSSINISS